MDSSQHPSALPVHEFPDGIHLLGHWKDTHLAYLRGFTTERRPLTQSVIHRVHHLHVSRIRLYKTMPRTFELASGSHWDRVNPDDAGRVAQIPLPLQHQHYHLIAEVSLPISLAQDGATPGNVTAAVQGYLRIEGNCAPAFAEFRRPSSIANASHLSAGGLPGPLTAGVAGLRSFGSFNPQPSANTSLFSAIDTTPMPTRQSTRTSETTPTGTQGRVEPLSPLSAKPTELIEDAYAFQPLAGSSLMEEPDTDMDESKDAVPARLDFSYLTRRSNSGSAGSSSPFISPFASRSSSLASGSRGSRSSTDTNCSQGTRPNSRSNSSNATSFSTASWFSLSSAGLSFSDNPLGRVAGMASADADTMFLVSYLGPQFVGFGPRQEHAIAESGDREECVLELSFPQQTTPSPPEGVGAPQGFLTLRDFAILADLVERSLETENDDGSADPNTDDTSNSGSSDGSGETDAMDLDTPDAIPQVTATCCCEYFRRLFDLIPLVSGLRPTTRNGGSPDPSPLTPLAALQASDQDTQSHHELYVHHGQYLQSEGCAEEAEHLKSEFERRKGRHDDQVRIRRQTQSHFDCLTVLSASPDSSTT